MIKAFFTSSHIFSVLKQFGELSEEVLICSVVGCDLVMAAYRICSCCAYVIHMVYAPILWFVCLSLNSL